MKTYTFIEFDQHIMDGGGDLQTDNVGQLIIYSGLFRWNDGSIRDQPDPSWDDDGVALTDPCIPLVPTLSSDELQDDE